MNNNIPTYEELCEVALKAFDEAMRKHGLNELQAFAFTYEHFEIFIDGEDAWTRLLALTAVFKTGVNNHVRLLQNSPFTEDVLQVLRSSYIREAPHEVSRRNVADCDVLRSDMEIVRKKYLA